MTEKNDRGYTMIIVMCLMFLFMALALSMLFSSAQTLARAEREAARKQSRASAVSFAEWIDGELEEPPSMDGTGKPNNLSGWMKKRLVGLAEGENGTWPAYTGELGGEADVAILTYTPVVNGTSPLREKELGQWEVKMYWETEDGGIDPNASDVNLVVTVKAVVQGEQFSVTTRYAKTLGTDEKWIGTWNVRGRE